MNRNRLNRNRLNRNHLNRENQVKRRNFCAAQFPVPFSSNLDRSPYRVRGFTLVELLVAVSITGILGAIGTPSWVNWRNNVRLNETQDEALQVLRQTQARAMRSKVELQVSFREVGQTVQWASHPTSVLPTASDWQVLSTGVRIDAAETTVSQSGGVYRVEFTHRGNINPPLGRLTFSAGNSRARRCVVLSTFLGAMRKASNNPTPDEGGRFCY